MSSLTALIADNVELLSQGVALLRGVDADTYARSHQQVALSGPGAHLRHLYDFYQRLLEGLDQGRVDYDARQRDARIEIDPDYAAGKLEQLVADLHGLAIAGLDPTTPLRIKSDAEGSPADEVPWTRSSLERELQAVLSHTVHHYALIAVALRLCGHDPGPEFGVAPSTLRYWQEQGACAR